MPFKDPQAKRDYQRAWRRRKAQDYGFRLRHREAVARSRANKGHASGWDAERAKKGRRR